MAVGAHTDETLLEEIRRRGIRTYVACNMRFMDTLRWLTTYSLTGRFQWYATRTTPYQ